MLFRHISILIITTDCSVARLKPIYITGCHQHKSAHADDET